MNLHSSKIGNPVPVSQ